MKPRRFTACSLIIATVATSFSGFAAPKAPPAGKTAPKRTLAERLKGDAKKHFDSAKVFYGQKKYDAALAEFNQAYTLSNEPRLLRNVAICEKLLGRNAKAYTTLEKALTEGLDFEDDLKLQIKTEIEALGALTATLKITVSEAGAGVTVDGESIASAPLDLRVEVGERVLVAKKDGFLPTTKKVSVAVGTVTPVQLELEPVNKVGTLRVKVLSPAGAKVVVDSKEVGSAPWEGKVTAGVHTVEVNAVDYSTYKSAHEVDWRKDSNIEVTLEKLKHEAILRLEANVDSTILRVDGKVVGAALYEGPLTSGTHTVTATADGYKPFRSEFALLDGQRRVMPIVLERESSTWYWWAIGGAAVVGAGIGSYFLFRPKDETPISGTLPPGTITIPLFR